MNREIKFQVISKGEIIGIERLHGTQWQWQYFLLNPDKGERWNNGVFGNSTDLIRRQFTGLKDKNGKEIYEGDVYISQSEKPCTVFYFMGAFTGGNVIENSAPIGWKVDDEETDLDPDFDFSMLEVIGNIYENPELLK